MKQHQPPTKTYWRVAYGTGTNALTRSGQVGEFLGYAGDVCRIRFADGAIEYFTPHELFPAPEYYRP